MCKKILLQNIDKIHTTEMGAGRIAKNLGIKEIDAVKYCKDRILDENCVIDKKGKNFYCIIGNEVITINSGSYTIITAKLEKEDDLYK